MALFTIGEFRKDKGNESSASEALLNVCLVCARGSNSTDSAKFVSCLGGFPWSRDQG